MTANIYTDNPFNLPDGTIRVSAHQLPDEPATPSAPSCGSTPPTHRFPIRCDAHAGRQGQGATADGKAPCSHGTACVPAIQ